MEIAKVVEIPAVSENYAPPASEPIVSENPLNNAPETEETVTLEEEHTVDEYA